MTFQILEYGDPEMKRFSDFVREHDCSHFLQDPSWSEVKTLWRWKGILVTNTDGQICGALSLLLRKLPLGLCFAYAPRGPVCDRLDTQVLSLLRQGLDAIAKSDRCILTYLDPDEPETNNIFRSNMIDLGFFEKNSDDFSGVQPQSVFRLSLRNKDETALINSFAQKTRYNIRLAQKRGVEVKRYPGGQPLSPEVLEHFEHLMITTGERDHFLVRNKEYFAQLLNVFGDYAVLYLAYLQNEPIAGTLGIFYGNKAWYLYGASSNSHRGAMPNYLLQWSMLTDALKKESVMYDFRGVPGTGKPEDPLYGLYRFKKGFSGTHTRFTGLFVRYHRPFLGRFFHYAQNIFRNLRKLRSHRR